MVRLKKNSLQEWTVILLEIVTVSPGNHLVKKHESQTRTTETQLKKKTSSKLKKLGSLCDQAVTESEDRLQNSLSQFTEIKMQSSYWNNKNEGTKINTVHIVKQQPHLTATEIVRTGFSTKASSDRSTFASYGTQPLNYFASLRIFMRQGHRTQR